MLGSGQLDFLKAIEKALHSVRNADPIFQTPEAQTRSQKLERWFCIFYARSGPRRDVAPHPTGLKL